MTQMTMGNTGKPSENSGSGELLAEQIAKKQVKQLVNLVQEEFTKSKNNRWKAERQWYLNLAMYFGKQNIQILDTPGGLRQFRLYTPPAPYYRSRPVVNRIRPAMRSEMAKLTAQKPNAFIVPASSDDRDMYAANAGEQIWDSLFRFKNLHKIIRRSVFWTSLTGNGFMKSWWDEEKMDVISQQMGDICYESITPFHMFVPDLKEVEIENQPFIIHAANRDAVALRMSYGKTINAGTADASMLEESFANVMGVNEFKGKKDTILTLEMWIKPNSTPLWPQGGMITVAGSDLLQITEGMPYEHQQYPFAHFRHVETGKFYSDSVIDDLIPLQREYNRTRGQIIESKNRMAKPQLTAEQGSLDPNKVTSEPGQIILYRPGFTPPQPLPLQSIPNYVLEEQDRIKQDMDDISGQHDVSRGQVPPGVTAATAISYLQEQDESMLSYTFDSLEEGVEKVAFQTLCYVKQYWDTPRKVKVTGEDGSFDVLAFEGSDLRDNTDIRVEAGSSLPTSRAAKQAFIMDLMKMGFIDPNKGLEVMEIGGINKIYEQVQTDVRQAQRENLKMAQATQELVDQHRNQKMQEVMQDPQAQELLQSGAIQIDEMTGTIIANGVPMETPLIVPVNSWDDHRIHIERHNNYRKSQAFENLDPAAKDLFEQHVNAHVSAIMIGAQGAMQMPAGMLDLANNPETIQEMQNQQQTGTDAQQQLPPVQSEQVPPEQAMMQGGPQ